MFLKHILSLLLTLLPFMACAVVAPAEPIRFIQPDGTDITVRIKGDRDYHIVETEDGVIIMKDKEGYFRYAGLDKNNDIAPLGFITKNPVDRSPEEIIQIQSTDKSLLLNRMEKLRRSPIPLHARSESAGLPGLQSKAFPAFGEQRALIVLVEYQDVRFDISDPKDYFSRLLNEQGFSQDDATGSARDYFISNSSGLFKPEFDVYGPILLEKERSYYGRNDYYYKSDENPEMMAIEACRQLDSLIDFSDYDRDKDGFIDNVFIFFAGRGEHDGGGDDAVWPHAAKITSWIPEPHVFDGVRLDAYGCACEKETGLDRPAAIGTFVHEFCHILGLPDLYPTYYSGAYTPGPYSVLDQGPYNNGGLTPPDFSIFERSALGWTEPMEFVQDGLYTLNPIGESNEGYIIPSSDFNEYYLLENRQQTGNDRFIPGHGMLVWHIRYDENAWETFSVNNDPFYQRVDLIEADGTIYSENREGHPFPGTNRITEFGFNTSPALEFSTGEVTKIKLTDISEKDGIINFNFKDDATEGDNVKEIKTGNADFNVTGRIIKATAPLSIYTLSGICCGQLNEGEEMAVSSEGIYLIHGPSGIVKIRLSPVIP